MSRVFLRFLVLVVLSISLATAGIYATFRALYGDPLEEIALRQAAGQVFLLEHYIDKAPADGWLERLNKVREVSDAHWELLPVEALAAKLSAGQWERLQAGRVVVDVAGQGLYRRVDLHGARYVDSDKEVLQLTHLPIDVGRVLGQELIRFTLVALCLLVPLAWWSRAHWRALQDLSRVASELGDGELKARAALPQRSSMQPLAVVMNQMAERIEQLLEAQRSLLRSVSHELRTPIARLGFGLELLRRADAPHEQAQRLAGMERDLAELDELVNELLRLNQLQGSDALRSAAFSIAACLRGSADAADVQRLGKTLTTEIADDLGLLDGDERLLRRAITNLLTNAAKYAARDVRLAATRQADGLHIVVEDDGPGIPAQARERIFEPFTRLDRDADQAHLGFGLGLAIVRRVVELHGGHVQVNESLLGGARFCVWLPATPEQSLPSPA